MTPGWLTSWSRAGTDCLPDTPVAAAKPGDRDRLFFGVIDWHFRIQRPQHLAMELAGLGHRVFYFSNEFVESAAPGFLIEALDREGRLFQVHLRVRGADAIYFGCPSARLRDQLVAGIEMVRAWAGIDAAVAVVQHPFWAPVWDRVRAPIREPTRVRGATTGAGDALVYDCMDYHEGFDTFADDLRAAERQLFRQADLTVVTSSWLAEFANRDAKRLALIRNAADCGFFSTRPATHYVDDKGRRVLGYYGALGSWFDVELVRSVAERFRDCLVLLVGSDQAGVRRSLRRCGNVSLTGEVPYADLPHYLYGFDVCLLPFKVMPLTLATNPVKMYEYLAAGRPVVAVDLPETRACRPHLDVASDQEAFCDRIAARLLSPNAGADARRGFAARQTWRHRALAFDHAIEEIDRHA